MINSIVFYNGLLFFYNESSNEFVKGYNEVVLLHIFLLPQDKDEWLFLFERIPYGRLEGEEEKE
jgi:hypothetical protein